MADLALDTALEFPALNDRQKTDLRAALGPKVALANPLDYHTYIWADEAAMARAYTAMMDPSLAMNCLVLDFPRGDRCDASDWDMAIDAAVAAKDNSGVPLALIASIPETMPEDVARVAAARGIVPFCGMAEALAAMDVGAWLGGDRGLPDPILLPSLPAGTKILSEAEAKAALSEHGVVVPAGYRVAGIDAAVEAAAGISGPVVLKGEGIAHKTEAGAVALNLSTEADVRQAAQRMQVAHFFVEEMISDCIVELLVGVVLDPAHGYVLTLGAGGTLTELMQDSVSLMIPASGEDVRTALSALRVAPLLAGYRGAPAANIDRVIDAVMAVQSYVMEHQGRVEEVEINPLICTPTRAVAADALIKAGE